MLIGVFGQQGSGKTLISVILSRMIVDKANQDVKVYTNINADGRGIVKIDDLGEIPMNREPKILILDEAMFSIDSRRAGSEANVVWTKLVAFFRKTNFLMVFFNTHMPSMIDNRIREQLAYIIMCRKSKERFEYLMLDMTSQQIKPFYMEKRQEIYQYANFDTYDFPDPIDVDLLIENNPKLFKVRNKNDKKRSAAQRAYAQ